MFLNQLRSDRRGATAVEYGLIAALISLACIIAFISLGLNLTNVFMTLSSAMSRG
jgi:pilus assembly protein Flp/PilA